MKQEVRRGTINEGRTRGDGGFHPPYACFLGSEKAEYGFNRPLKVGGDKAWMMRKESPKNLQG